MSDGIKLDFKVHFTAGQCGSRVMHAGERAAPPPVPSGRVPRISRLMALAIRFEDLVRSGEMADFAEIAELGQVTRARVSQIVNLLNLAPDIQEAILFLPLVGGGTGSGVGAGGTGRRGGSGLGAAAATMAEPQGLAVARACFFRNSPAGIPSIIGSGQRGTRRPRAIAMDCAATSHISRETRCARRASSVVTTGCPYLTPAEHCTSLTYWVGGAGKPSFTASAT